MKASEIVIGSEYAIAPNKRGGRATNYPALYARVLRSTEVYTETGVRYTYPAYEVEVTDSFQTAMSVGNIFKARAVAFIEQADIHRNKERARLAAAKKRNEEITAELAQKNLHTNNTTKLLQAMGFNVGLPGHHKDTNDDFYWLNNKLVVGDIYAVDRLIEKLQELNT